MPVVPLCRLHNREYDGTLKVSGAKMTVKGCLGPVCQSQTWHRVD